MLHLLDTYAAGISLLCSALFECIAVSWFYGKYTHIYKQKIWFFARKKSLIHQILLFFLGLEKFCDDVENMIGHRPGLYWRICWKFISPLFIIVSREIFKTSWNTKKSWDVGDGCSKNLESIVLIACATLCGTE